jgi:hypothetical protein
MICSDSEDFGRSSMIMSTFKWIAALIEQLRAGYAQLVERSAKVGLPLSGGAGVGGRAPSSGYASQEELWSPNRHFAEMENLTMQGTSGAGVI